MTDNRDPPEKLIADWEERIRLGGERLSAEAYHDYTEKLVRELKRCLKARRKHKEEVRRDFCQLLVWTGVGGALLGALLMGLL